MLGGNKPQSQRRWLLLSIAIQVIGYSLLWFVLHLPEAAPAPSAWYGAQSAYRSGVMQLPPVVWLQDNPILRSWLLRACFAISCVGYVWALFAVRRLPMAASGRLWLYSILLCSVPLLLAPQIFSSDLFIYSMFGRTAVLYGGNPYINVPADFAADPFVPLVGMTEVTSIYGPVWTYIALPITILAELLGGAVSVYQLLFKLFALACHLVNTWLIRRMLQHTRPDAAGWGTLMYGWHPLIMIEGVLTGHNDIWLVTLLLLALTCALKRWHTRALVCLVLGGMVKVVLLLLVPLYALYVVYQQDRSKVWLLVRQTLLGVGVIILVYAPFWDGPQTLDFGTASVPLSQPYAGPASWVIDKFSFRECVTARLPAALGESVEQAQPRVVMDAACRTQIIGRVAGISLSMFAGVYLLLTFWPVRSLHAWIDRAVWILLAYILLAAIHFGAWYGIWMLALVPLMRRPRHLIWIGGCTLLLLYGEVPITGRTPFSFAPLVLLVAIEIWRNVRPLWGFLLPAKRLSYKPDSQ